MRGVACRGGVAVGVVEGLAAGLAAWSVLPSQVLGDHRPFSLIRACVSAARSRAMYRYAES